MITLLNSSVLTEFGLYDYKEINIEEAKKMLNEEGFVSSIGHKSTAKFLSALTGLDIFTNRNEYKQKPGEKVIVFKINQRLTAGMILKENEIKNYDFTIGLLVRNK